MALATSCKQAFAILANNLLLRLATNDALKYFQLEIKTGLKDNKFMGRAKQIINKYHSVIISKRQYVHNKRY
ncbi:MAG: hypothetical protein WCQ90_00880 [Deltaproteobacteria bacterium]